MSSILSLSSITIAEVEWEYEVVQLLSKFHPLLQYKLHQQVRSLELNRYTTPAHPLLQYKLHQPVSSSPTLLSSYVSITSLSLSTIDTHKLLISLLPSTLLSLSIEETSLFDTEVELLPQSLTVLHMGRHQLAQNDLLQALPSSLTDLSVFKIDGTLPVNILILSCYYLSDSSILQEGLQSLTAKCNSIPILPTTLTHLKISGTCNNTDEMTL